MLRTQCAKVSHQNAPNAQNTMHSIIRTQSTECLKHKVLNAGIRSSPGKPACNKHLKLQVVFYHSSQLSINYPNFVSTSKIHSRYLKHSLHFLSKIHSLLPPIFTTSIYNFHSPLSPKFTPIYQRFTHLYTKDSFPFSPQIHSQTYQRFTPFYPTDELL